ncbi:c-type cytochrome [Parapedobacter koreensis]|uniref:Cytochrome C oxidase, cbb3-type, subunit III n=1 Tax=Parapedobacter koreensis TaxID=332977 RepID=A0A1H7I364_9SPHI|nr:cytochrome c [Parapedobacter koreensis]SEK56996.1 Cytochrome C oxidase, cbb3-type, subunit III [Parapedobacter koreensis]
MTRNSYLYAGAALAAIYLSVHACQSEQAIRTAQYAVNGQKLYAAQCQNCHGAKGEGLGKLYPPLTDSLFLLGHRDQLACIVKNGLSDTISIHGQFFDAEMPPNPRLAPIEIAYVLTYVGNSFGNEMGIFTLEEIEQALKACK